MKTYIFKLLDNQMYEVSTFNNGVALGVSHIYPRRNDATEYINKLKERGYVEQVS